MYNCVETQGALPLAACLTSLYVRVHEDDGMIATLFGRKKITEDRLSNAFVNSILALTENGFPNVAAELIESPEFATAPFFGPEDEELFALIVLAGNLMEAPRWLGAGQDKRFVSLSISKFSEATGRDCSRTENQVMEMQGVMGRLNHPSKNTVYAMSKAVFHHYGLFRFQDDYFRELKAPNPIILRRIDNLMAFFLWNWEEFMGEYKVV